MKKKTYEVELRLTGFVRIEVEAENKDEATELATEEFFGSDYPGANDHEVKVESIEACDTDGQANLFGVELRLTSFVCIRIEAENADEATELAIEELYNSDHPNAQDHDVELESIGSIEHR